MVRKTTRQLTQAEVDQRRAAAAARVTFTGRPRTVDAAWTKAMQWAAQKVRGLARAIAGGRVDAPAEALEELAKDLETARPPEKR